MINTIEKWNPLPSEYGDYQVSSLGFIRRNGNKLMPSKSNSGYLGVTLWKNGVNKSYNVHTLVAVCFLDHTPNRWGVVVDHINECKQDNRLVNLRLTTNRKNISTVRGTSKYTGVHFHKTQLKWCANIFVNGKRKYLGSFDLEIDAHNKYQETLKSHLLCRQK